MTLPANIYTKKDLIRRSKIKYKKYDIDWLIRNATNNNYNIYSYNNGIPLADLTVVSVSYDTIVFKRADGLIYSVKKIDSVFYDVYLGKYEEYIGLAYLLHQDDKKYVFELNDRKYTLVKT